MTNEKFLTLRDKFTTERFAMCDRKSVGYTEGDDDRHANFKFISREINEPALKVLNTYMLKHFHSYLHYCKTGEESGEGIAQTIADLMNYLDLALALIQEQCEDSLSPYTPDTPGYAEREKVELTLSSITDDAIKAWGDYKRTKGAITHGS